MNIRTELFESIERQSNAIGYDYHKIFDKLIIMENDEPLDFLVSIRVPQIKPNSKVTILILTSDTIFGFDFHEEYAESSTLFIKDINTNWKLLNYIQ